MAGALVLDEFAQPPDAQGDLFGGEHAEGEPGLAEPGPAAVEVVHGRPQHTEPGGRVLQHGVVSPERQREDDEHAALGRVPRDVLPGARPGGEHRVQGLQQRRQVAAVDRGLAGGGTLETAAVLQQVSADHRLRDGRGVERDHALHLREMVGEQHRLLVRGARRRDRLVGDDVAHPGAGERGLGERAEVDHPVVLVQGLEHRQRGTAGTEEGVRVVLDDEDLLAPRQLQQGDAVRQGHARATGVGEVGDDVTGTRPQTLAPRRPYLPLQVLQVDAALVFPYRAHRRAGHPGRADEPDVVGGGGQDDIAGVTDQGAQQQHHRLLAAGGHHDALRVDRQPLVDLQLARYEFVDEPLGPPVLEERAPHLLRGKALLALQIIPERAQVTGEVVDVVEALERAARGERHRLRIPSGEFVEQRHGRERGIIDRRVQIGDTQPDRACFFSHSTSSSSAGQLSLELVSVERRLVGVLKNICGSPRTAKENHWRRSRFPLPNPFRTADFVHPVPSAGQRGSTSGPPGAQYPKSGRAFEKALSSLRR